MRAHRPGVRAHPRLRLRTAAGRPVLSPFKHFPAPRVPARRVLKRWTNAMTTTTRTASLFAVLSALSLGACDDPGERPEGVTVDDEAEVMSFAVPTAPSALPPGDGGGDGPADPLPDLIVEATATTTVGPIGDYWYCTFRVKNIGTATAPKSKAGVLLLDDWNVPDVSGVHTADVPALSPGAGAWVTVKFATTDVQIAGYTEIGWSVYDIIDYKTRQIADATKIVDEKLKTNNSYTIAW